MFPKLRFELHYEESGMGFKGTLIMEKDKVVSDEDAKLVSCPLCYNDVVDCGDSIEEIEKHMKSEGDDAADIKKMIAEIKDCREKDKQRCLAVKN
jgi:hypothetical protein